MKKHLMQIIPLAAAAMLVTACGSAAPEAASSSAEAVTSAVSAESTVSDETVTAASEEAVSSASVEEEAGTEEVTAASSTAEAEPAEEAPKTYLAVGTPDETASHFNITNATGKEITGIAVSVNGKDDGTDLLEHSPAIADGDIRTLYVPAAEGDAEYKLTLTSHIC